MSTKKENILSAIAFCAAYSNNQPKQHSNPNKMMEAACNKFGISLHSKTFRDVLELRGAYERELKSENYSIDKPALLEKIKVDAKGRRGFPADRVFVFGDTRQHGSIGVRTFSDQSAAEDYLKALPAKYTGRCYKSENGKWTVAYHRLDVPDPTSNDERGSK